MRLEFQRCCGTACNKVLGLRQIQALVELWRLLKTPLQRFNNDRVCYIKEKGVVIGVFIPIKDLERLQNQFNRTTK